MTRIHLVAVWLLLGLSLALLPAVASAEPLCTDTWSGPAEGEWETAADWSAAHKPTSSDVACIGTGKTVKVRASSGDVAAVIQGAGAIVMEAGSLEVTSLTEKSSIATLKSSSGTLRFTDELSVTSSYEASGGTVLSGPGKLVLASGASGTIGSSGNCRALTMSEATLVNDGTLTFGVVGGGAYGTIVMNKGSQLQNAGTFNADSYGTSCGFGSLAFDDESEGSPAITNSGTFDVQAGASATEAQVAFVNTGSVEVKSGTLELAAGGSSEAGSWTSASGTKTVFRTGTFALNSTTWSGAGTFSLTGATISASSLHASAAKVSLSGGQLNIASGSSTIESLTSSGATLDLTGELTVSSAFGSSNEQIVEGSGKLPT